MDSKIVNREIKKIIWPLLKENGFDIFTSRTAWKQSDIKIDVISFQSFNSFLAAGLKCTSYSFAINLGVYFKCIPETMESQTNKNKLEELPNKICPKDFYCHIRRSLRKSLAQPEFLRGDIWSIAEDGSNLDKAISDAVKVINSEAFKWFNRFDNYDEAIRTLTIDEEDMEGTWGFGRNPSPIRNYYTGYISLALGDYNLAARSLKEAIESKIFQSAHLNNDYEFAFSHVSMSEKPLGL